MPILQPIIDLAELLYKKGISDVVVCPGSRSAPLTLAVARHPHLRVRVMADERSAGFIGLGIALQTQKPVVLICTSGSAVYNLAPAVAEAFFQQIPLLLLTADRPHEWLYQQDGQTIDQIGIFGKQVKRSYDLPADYVQPDARWFIERTVNEAVTLSQFHPAGPVHINVPLREPFYPRPDESFTYNSPRLIDVLPTTPSLSSESWHQLLGEFDRSERRLIALGQLTYNPVLLKVLKNLSQQFGIPIIGEITSNLPVNDTFITHTDTFLTLLDSNQAEALRPDLLITLGNSFLTRNLKTFFRQYPAPRHWHIQPYTDRITDSFQSVTTLIPAEPVSFLEKLFADIDYQHFLEGDEVDTPQTFLNNWLTAKHQAQKLVEKTITAPDKPFTDWVAIHEVLEHLPHHSILHLANSMPVRYANLCGIAEHQHIQVFANRGVSGIDGCLSTAVGAALKTDKLVTILLGDVAFFYDRNALWSFAIPANLRIVLLNNDGGHIFRLIDGSNQQPELETYFETPHGYTARNTAADARIDYIHCQSVDTLSELLDYFFQPAPTAKLLELTTDKHLNQQQFLAYKNQIINLRNKL